MVLFKASKINVIGTSGTGKSTFAKKLSAALDIPYIEMDKIFWLPNWTEPTNEVFFEHLKRVLEAPAWVLDGNYTRTVPIKWQKVDLVIWLDYSFPRTLFQAICRAFQRAWTQEELWEGTGNRKKYESYMNDTKFSHIRFIRIRNHVEARKFLNNANLST